MDHVDLADGRRVDVRVTGPESGRVVLFHPGTPAAGTRLRVLEGPAYERGLRVVSLTRPGYAGSTRLPGRSVVDVVGDADQVLRHLEVDSALVLGWSGGGAHALACAARLPQATAAAVIASGAPVSAQGLDWFAGMHPGNVEGFRAAIEGESSLRPLLEKELPDLLPGSAEELARVMAEGAAEVDRTYLRGERVEDFLAGNRAALRAGVDGWCDDALALAKDWGFEVGEITVPTMVWHGGADVFAPFAHGQWLADRIPQVRAHLFPEEGHFSTGVGRMGEILDELISAGG